MRTKVLCAAALAAGALTSMAQVYSANIVGYVNMSQNAGTFNIWANPLSAANNDVTAVFANASSYPGLAIYKFNGAGYDIASFDPDLGDWSGTVPMDLSPGTAFWVQTPGGAAYANTFVGTVVTNASVSIPKGFSLKGSAYPSQDLIKTKLGLPIDFGDAVYFYNGVAYDVYSLDPDLGDWSPSEPSPKVAQGFWVQSSAARTWTQSFAP